MKLLASAAILCCAAVARTAASDAEETSLRGLRKDSNGGRGPPSFEVPVVDLSVVGDELIEPEQISSPGKAVKATLRFGIVEYVGPAYTTKVRAYNGVLPGPTIRVKPGDKLHLMLVNDLTEPVGYLKNNEYQHPNQTNIHTHGPHISGENPGDNVFEKIEESDLVGYSEEWTGKNVGPKQFHHYSYEFDGNHMPGTFWYHPHLHGSTALQTSTASGMLIIEDPEDYPATLKEMPEVQMMIYRLEIGDGPSANATCGFPPAGDPEACGEGGLKRFSVESQDQVSSWTEGEGFTVTDSTFEPSQIFEKGIWMPNFQVQPKKTIKPNTWYRFRMALAVTDLSVVMEFEEKNCEMQLLAKDGVYVKVDPTVEAKNDYGPRPIDAIFLSPGNRADVAIRCTADDKMIQITEGGTGGFDPKVTTPKPGQGTIFSIEVDGDEEPTDLDEFFDIATPCYQADLREVETDPAEYFTVFYNPFGEPMKVFAGVGNPITGAIAWIDDQTPIRTLELGKVYKMGLGTAGAHPHHQHVNHFQLQELEDSLDYADMSELTKTYFKSGDWHDMFQWPELFVNTPPPAGAINIDVKWPANQFSGRMTFHCHRLNHEDLGMIAFFQVDGEEGTLVNTTEIDPTCLPPAGKGNGN